MITEILNIKYNLGDILFLYDDYNIPNYVYKENDNKKKQLKYHLLL